MGNNEKKRKSGQRPKKHKFRGNQYSNSKHATPVKATKNRLSASSRKLNGIPMADFKDTSFKGYSIIDKNIIFSAIEECLSCKICGGNITFSSQVIGGLSEKFFIHCENCGEVCAARNSVMHGTKKNTPEINLRFVYAMRILGQGLLGAKTFCGIMDLPSPVTVSAYNKIVNNIVNVTSKAAENSMASAVKEEISLNEGSTDITISGDGTWKTRGHSSLVGVCTVIGSVSGKVIEAEVLSSVCKGCSSWKGVRAGEDYLKWNIEHSEVCQKNHTGSAGMMEVVGMRRIFERSGMKHGIRYANYIGDGDCKTFNAIEKAEPYGKDLKVSKIECVGHVQKRMGCRLRKRKQELKGKKLSDGKSIGGKGRLTDDLINKLTIYYGNAIRSHKNSVKEMQKAIWAIFYHKRSYDLEPTHDFCPAGEQSWCAYQREHAISNAHNFKHKNSVPYVVMDAIKDIFKDLSMPSLLKKCLGGHTQNNNESLNALIWKICPKTSGSGANIVKIAVSEAVVVFNEGQIGRLKTMTDFGFQIGVHAKSFAADMDESRINFAEKKALMSTLEARRARKRAKLAAEEAAEEEEGVIYASGMF